MNERSLRKGQLLLLWVPQSFDRTVNRVKGFEVENGRVNNPLLVVSPGTRYSYPDDIERLCESL